MKKNQLTLH